MARIIDIGGSYSSGLSRECYADLASIPSTGKLGNLEGAMDGSSFRGDRFLSGHSCGHFGLAVDRRQFSPEDNDGNPLYPVNYPRLFDHERGKGTSHVEFINDDPIVTGFGHPGGEPER